MAKGWRNQWDVTDDQDPGPDLWLGFSGVALLLFVVALIGIGTPKIKASELYAERERREAAEAGEAEASRHSAGLAAQVGELQAKVVEAGNVYDDMQAVITQLQDEKRRRAVQVVIAFDGSGSTGLVVDEVRAGADLLSNVGPAITTKFEFGVVVYRNDLTVFPLQELNDAGRRAWDRFSKEPTEREDTYARLGKPSGEFVQVPKFSSVNSRVATADSIRRALEEFDAPRADTHRVLIVIGDMGVWESGDMKRIDGNERAVARDVVRDVERFAAEDGSHVVALFIGAKNTDLALKTETRAFFKQLAGADGTYSELTSEITAAVLRASLTPGGTS